MDTSNLKIRKEIVLIFVLECGKALYIERPRAAECQPMANWNSHNLMLVLYGAM